MTTRTITFSVNLERLTRHVRLADGREYAHVCTLGVFERVLDYLDEHPTEGTTAPALWRALPDLPFTQIHVALDFLAEYRLVARVGKKTYPRSPALYEEAMEHFFFLQEARPGT